MALNQEGIKTLAGYLVANSKFYNQDDYGIREDCGTKVCMAGFCRLNKIGKRKFNQEIKNTFFEDGSKDWREHYVFANACEADGENLLGLDVPEKEHQTVRIFENHCSWPEDLEQAFDHAKNAEQKVLVALRALQRLLPDGEIDEDPEVVHNDLSEYITQVS